MRIGILAPLIERVPPPAYGGTEAVVGLLTEELVRRGRKVTLFASGDSITSAKLRSTYPCSLRNLRLGDGSLDLLFERRDHEVSLEIARNEGGIEVVILHR